MRLVFSFFILALAMSPTTGMAFEIPDQFKGGLVVVQSATMAPMCFKGVNGEAKGFIPDFWRKWSAETGVPVTFKLMGWKESIEYVQEHGNVVHGGLFQTPERLKLMEFSEPLFPVKGALFVMKGTNACNIEDMAGRTVAVLEKGSSEELLRKEYPDVKLVSYETITEMVRAFVHRDVEGIVTDYPTVMYVGGTFGAVKDLVPLDILIEDYLRVGVAKGSVELLDMISRGLELVDDEERESILRRWFVAEVEESNTLLLTVFLSVGGLLTAMLVLYLSGRRRESQKI